MDLATLGAASHMLFAPLTLNALQVLLRHIPLAFQCTSSAFGPLALSFPSALQMLLARSLLLCPCLTCDQPHKCPRMVGTMCQSMLLGEFGIDRGRGKGDAAILLGMPFEAFNLNTDIFCQVQSKQASALGERRVAIGAKLRRHLHMVTLSRSTLYLTT